MLNKKQTDESLSQMKFSHLRNMTNGKPPQKRIRVCLDSDVLEWLKSEGKGYQARMNAILRKAMLHSLS